MSFKKITIIILIISAISAGAIGYWYWQKNIYSKGILKLEILSESEIQGFDEIEYLVKYKNNGDITLEDAELIFEYPENSQNEEKFQRVIKKLEDIYPGEEKSIFFKTRIFGKENEIKIAKVSLTYRPKNLKAFYISETTYSTKIKFVPLSFEFDLPSKAETTRPLKILLNYFSNSDFPLSDLRIIIEYPSGFEFLESKPSALEETDWDISLLNKAEGGRIEINGNLSGEIREQKIFKAKIGIWKENQFILLKEEIRGVEISNPQLAIYQQINGTENYIASPGDLLHFEIFFRNIGEESFSNLFLISRLNGQAFNFETIKSDSGQFNSGDNSLIWDYKEILKLRFLDQGEEGKVEFWINLKEDWEVLTSQDKNFTLKNKIILSQIKEEFETKVNSKLVVLQTGYFEDEVFGNSGPIPPEVGANTTYTIIWQAKNYYSNVRNAKIKATLPRNVKLTGKIFPEDSRLTFDLQSREIVWEIGDLIAGSGILNPASNVAFQISLFPTEDQKGQIVSIINKAKISGEDEWTERILESTISAIDTTLPDDSTVNRQQGIVK